MTGTTELQKQIDDAPEGAIIPIPTGRYEGQLIIPRPMILKGMGPELSIIDGHGRGPVIAVDANDGLVRLEGLTITGGRAQAGAGVVSEKGAQLEIISCVITGNGSDNTLGGGLGATRSNVVIRGSEISNNRGKLGGALHFTYGSRVTVIDSSLQNNNATQGAGIAVTGDVELLLENSKMLNNLARKGGHHLYSASTQNKTPTIVLRNMILVKKEGAAGPSIYNDVKQPATYRLEGTEWPKDSGRAPQ